MYAWMSFYLQGKKGFGERTENNWEEDLCTVDQNV